MSAPSNLSNCKILRKKTKIPELGTKYALIWNQKCFIWVFLGWNLKMILSYLKSAPLIMSNSRINEIRKMPKFGTKNVLITYFWAKHFKTIIVIF